MEVLFDVLGVGLIIWGILWAIGTVARLFLGYTVARSVELSKGWSVVVGVLVAVLSAAIAAFLIWAGFEVVGIENV